MSYDPFEERRENRRIRSMTGDFDVPGPKREYVRRVDKDRTKRKKFKKTFETNKQINPDILNPHIVAYDLSEGRLSSLDRYLKKHGGIPDREVAVELRKLISGTKYRTKYQLAVIEHPNRPPRKGGRPKSRNSSPSEREHEIAEIYDNYFRQENKGWRALELTAETCDVTPRTVERARSKVNSWRIKEAEEKQQIARSVAARNSALKKLREQN